MISSIEFYSTNGITTSISKYKKMIEPLTSNPKYISQIVQGLLTHGAWPRFYGFENSEERTYYSMYMSSLLDRIFEYDDRSITQARLPENRVIACCREFASLTCAIMREKNIPARVRGGFSSYLGWKGSFEDHWITEYWDGSNWIRIDPQIDPMQISYIEHWGFNKVSLTDGTLLDSNGFDPQCLRKSDFATAGEVWKWCRSGMIDPNICGVDEYHGLWFVRQQLLMEFAALNKIELALRLCDNNIKDTWESWSLNVKNDAEVTVEEYKLLDTIAELTIDPDKNLKTIIEMYNANPALQVPEVIYERA